MSYVDLMYKPAEWFMELPTPLFLLLIAPFSALLLLWWLLLAVPLVATIVAPWIGLSLLVHWLAT